MRTRFILAALALLLLAGLAAGGLALRNRFIHPTLSAEALVRAGDLRGALLALRAEIRARPDDPAPHIALANLHLRLLDPAAARQELARALTLRMDRTAVLAELGPVLLADNKFREVLQQLPPDTPNPQVAAKLHLARAAAHLGLGDLQAAAASLQAVDRAIPNQAATATMQARLDLARDDLPAAERSADLALRRDPAASDALIMKVRFAMARGDQAAALSLSDRAVAAVPWSNVARLDRAALLMAAGDDPKARLDIDAALANQPRDSAALLAHAVLTLRAGRYAEAASELQRLGNAARFIPRALFFQAMVAGYLNQNESALDFAARYVALAPEDPDGLRLLARLELAVQRPDRALLTLRRIEEPDAADPRTTDLFGTAYTMLGRLPEAADAFRRAAARAPDDVDVLRHLGLTQTRTESAGLPETLDKLSALAPTAPRAGEALVVMALAARRLDRAADELARLQSRTGPTEAVGLLNAALLIARQDPKGAEAALRDTARRFPASTDARFALAQVMISGNRPQEAEALLKPLLAAEPANLRLLAPYVQSLMDRADYAPAIAALDAARTASPGNTGLAAIQADAMMRAGQPKEAAAMLHGLYPLADMPPILLAHLSRAEVASNRPDQARATFAQAVQLSPGDPGLRLAQADFLIAQDDGPGARAVLLDAGARTQGNYALMTALLRLEERTAGLDRALALAAELRARPENMPQAAVLAGDLLARSGRYAQAAAAFQAEQRAVPGSVLAMRAAAALAAAGREDEAAATLRTWLAGNGTPDPEAESRLSKLDIKAGRYAEAQAGLERILAGRPTDADALNNLAWVYARQRDPRALETARRAYVAAPTPDVADTLGWILLQQGNARAAVTLLREAAKARPDDPAIAFHLAAALREIGERAEATTLLERITAQGRAFEEASQARDLLRALAAP